MRLAPRCGSLVLIITLIVPPALLCAREIQAESKTAGGQTTKHRRLPKESRAELAAARARGESTATLVIAAREGANEVVAKAVTAAGGSIQYRNDEVSYLRAEAPIDSAEVIADNNAIDSLALDVSSMAQRTLQVGRTYQNSNASPEPFEENATQDRGTESNRLGSLTLAPGKTEWSDLPFKHPYSPLKDLGATELRQNHPTFDGRGVTIAHVEGPIDLLLPEFESALSIDGRKLPKVVDVLDAVAPDHQHDRGLFAFSSPWTKMDSQIDADTKFSANGESYSSPRKGHFRFGIFEGRQICQKLKPVDPEVTPTPLPDRDTPHYPLDPQCRFGVLWDEQTNEVWLDTNQNKSFADEKALTDYSARHDVGIIGQDDPRTPARESLAFTVQSNQDNKYVAINVGNGTHSTMVAGSVAGSKGTRGFIDGIAPGAQLLEISHGDECIAGLIEALIKAFSDPRSDIVLLEQNVYFSNSYTQSDGRFIPEVIASRLVDRYEKPFVVPAGNNPALNATEELGNVLWGFSVGVYETKESYLLNRGVLTPGNENLHIVGAWGPNGNGEIKPDVVVPSGYLTTAIPGRAQGVKGLYRLPPGYMIGSGTSQGAPTLAGALALMMSAAKQEHVSYDAERIWLSVANSARNIPNLFAHQQGNGAVDVSAAYMLLKDYAKTPPSIKIISSAGVQTGYSGWLETPNQGVSIWETKNWEAGQRGERVITLTRTTGPQEPLTFNISWSGNDGTFSSANAVTLPLNKSVSLPVTIAPTVDGAHSALLSLTHPPISGPVYRLLTTIVAANRLTAASGFSLSSKGKLELGGGPGVLYFKVPDGAEAIATDGSGGNFSTIDPLGFYVFGSASRLTALPRTGTWSAIMEPIFNENAYLDTAWRTLPGEICRVPYNMNVTLLGTVVTAPSSLQLDYGSSQTIEVSAENKFGTFNGGLVSTAIGAARSLKLHLTPREQKVIDIEVPEGCSLLL
ncbi:MAG TPA: S8 family serine peptidase, partial [Pyrinomonadaceae bacterium]|nr:S8 family serine peptidase [Pyrinomonadaceae bacterium]